MDRQNRPFQIITIATLSFMIVWGIIIVLLPLRPFCRDEWCIIYNIKFKNSAQLWGHLDFTQQFPRVYLQVVKLFTAWLRYNYFSLRFPSFLTASAVILFSYYLMNKLFFEKQPARYLFVLLIAANPIFIDYFVQIKHYEMEVLLSLVAIWQLLVSLKMRENTEKSDGRYFLLCAVFFVAPFFSYTYPIAVLPVFMILFVYDVLNFKNRTLMPGLRHLCYLWIPLFIGIAGIALFYFIDAAQLMRDRNMYGWWQDSLVTHSTTYMHIVKNLWLFFAKAGAGFVFEIVFGILGIVSFVVAIYTILKELKLNVDNKAILVQLYAVLLVAVVIGLYFAGRIPFGYPRFTMFAIPAMAILIVFSLDKWGRSHSLRRTITWLHLILFIALVGNIFSACINLFVSDDYRKQREIYTATEKAIGQARQSKMPIFITPDVGYPDDITKVLTFLSMPTADGILKTFPAYHTDDTIAIYSIKDLKNVEACRQELLQGGGPVLAGDGLLYKIY